MQGGFHVAEKHVWDDWITDEDRELYKAYQDVRGFGTKPAVLVIDVYNAAFGDRPEPVLESVKRFPSSCGERAWQALPYIQSLLQTAREHDVPIFYCTREARSETQPGQVVSTKRKERNTNPEWDYAIKEEVAPQPGDVIIYKQRASAFFGTPLIAHLVQRNIDTLIVCGESTSGCVRASVLEAYAYGLRVCVVEEGVFDRSWTSHCINLFDMKHKYADVLKTDQVIEYLKNWKQQSAQAV